MPRKSAKKAGNTGFLTELGIDRLYPEPKSNFLPFGSPKSQQKQIITQENVKIPDFGGRGVWARFSALFFLLKGLPIRPRGVGGMGRSR